MMKVKIKNGMSKTYIIHAPSIVKNHASNGIRVLHYLYKELRAKGYEAYMYSPAPHSHEYEYIKKITNFHRKNSVIVYPETVTGNPLRFRNVVRYVLNFPGLLGGTKDYHHSETIFTWDKKYYQEADELFIPHIDKKIFYKDDTPKTMDCVFVYKKGKFREIKELESLTEINIKWPETREELGDLLRKTKTLYSYDNCSAILNEAINCGVRVKIITENDIIDHIEDYVFSKEYVDSRLNNFIKITQNLDYKGKIESIDILDYAISALKLVYFKLTNNEVKYNKHKDRLTI